MDPRLTPANDRAALLSLKAQVTAPRFTTGEAARLTAPLADLCSTANGPRQRQLLLGDTITVIDRHLGWAFVQSTKDGYCGYLPETGIGAPADATHWVAAPSSQLYPEPRIQAREIAALPFGARLRVTGQVERFAETPDGFVPALHLRPIDDRFADPVDVAMLFLGAPYLWGGNSRAGIDCSGLVQAALLACGVFCPGDSDLQRAIGSALAPEEPLGRGDLICWKGHIAIAVDNARIIHASGHVMAVTLEDTEAAIARIAATGLPVIARRRTGPKPSVD